MSIPDESEATPTRKDVRQFSKTPKQPLERSFIKGDAGKHSISPSRHLYTSPSERENST